MKPCLLKLLMMLFVVVSSALLCACKAIVNKLAFYPDNIHVIPAIALPEEIQALSTDTDDDITITSLFLPAHDSDKLVIYFHGNGGNIYGRLPSLIQLRNFGFNVIGAGYRGYGQNEGEPSEDGLYLDGKTVFDFAINELGFLPENIVILGRSIGTTVAINTAQYQEIAGLILVTPLTSGKAHAELGIFRFVSWLAGDAFNNLDKIKHVKAPVLIIHGNQDHVIPYFMGEEIYHAAVSKKTLVTIDGAGHNDLHDVYGQQYWSSIFDFLHTAWK